MILVVDDEADSRTLLTTILTSEGYPVRAADGGELALASIPIKPPELILLDIRMPEMDGFEVCRRFKQNAQSRDIPVIFLSASKETSERIEGFRLGAVDFVSKPFQQEELLARVQRRLNGPNVVPTSEIVLPIVSLPGPALVLCVDVGSVGLIEAGKLFLVYDCLL